LVGDVEISAPGVQDRRRHGDRVGRGASPRPSSRDTCAALSVEDDDSPFYFQLMNLLAFECRTQAAGIFGAAHALSDGTAGELREDMVELIREESERLSRCIKMLSVASWTALGTLHPDHLSTRNARQIADQAHASLRPLTGWLEEDVAAKVRVSGEGVAVVADETVEAGFAIIVNRIVRDQAGLWVAVDGAEITLGPLPADDDVRRFVIGDDPMSFEAGLAVRVIRALGGSVDLDGDRLRFRFPEPRSSEAAR